MQHNDNDQNQQLIQVRQELARRFQEGKAREEEKTRLAEEEKIREEIRLTNIHQLSTHRDEKNLSNNNEEQKSTSDIRYYENQTALPAETLENIFSFLPNSDRGSVLLACGFFHSVIFSMPKKHLDYSKFLRYERCKDVERVSQNNPSSSRDKVKLSEELSAILSSFRQLPAAFSNKEEIDRCCMPNYAHIYANHNDKPLLTLEHVHVSHVGILKNNILENNIVVTKWL